MKIPERDIFIINGQKVKKKKTCLLASSIHLFVCKCALWLGNLGILFLFKISYVLAQKTNYKHTKCIKMGDICIFKV